MNLKQKLLKALYPLIMEVSKLTNKGKLLRNKNQIKPATPFYGLKTVQSSGKELDFSQFKDKKVLIVNTASNCGFTGQFAELQRLQDKYGEKLAIIGFPANDFKEQEKGPDEQIIQFCQVNYGVTFPLSKKSSVVKGREQNAVFQWLSHAELNGWNNQQPDWNFSKFLIDEKGVLTHYFGPAVSPLSTSVVKALEK